MFSYQGSWRHLQATTFLLGVIAPTVIAISGSDRWTAITNTTAYNSLEPCNQECLLAVSMAISCWAYGCVCSSNDQRGNNVFDGYTNVTACARNKKCPGKDAASDAFQEICSVHFDPIPSGTATAPTAKSQSPTATPAFKGETFPRLSSQGGRTNDSLAENAVMIDLPGDSYTALNSSCLRWVFNGCKSKKDNAQNCRPKKPVDNTRAWTGLGAFMQCSTAECLCRYPKFDYSSERAFETAMEYCGAEPPTQEKPSQEMESMVNLMAGFCSDEGFVLTGSLLAVQGVARQRGKSYSLYLFLNAGVLNRFQA
jgi:hypothetical protein